MVTRKRHLTKTLTWRITATSATVLIAWFVTGKFTVGLAIGGTEAVVKTVLYYVHERAWSKTQFGITGGSVAEAHE